MSLCQLQEPLTISAGDTIYFQKFFECYQPSNGWQLQYQVRGGAGAQMQGNQDVNFQSTVDSTGTIFVLTVMASVTANWKAGSFVLAGYAVNSTNVPPLRHEIYQNDLIITPNYNSPTDNVDTKTHSQKMVELIESQLLVLANNYLQATTVQQTEIIRVKRKELDEQLAFYREKRNNEIAFTNVRNGLPSGQRILPTLNIVEQGSGWSNQSGWPFTPTS